jgi:excisionase family DNA binding protein
VIAPAQAGGLVLTIPRVARELGLSVKTIRRLIGDGLLPARRLGGKTIILRGELERFLANLPTITSLDRALAQASAQDRANGRPTEEVAR